MTLKTDSELMGDTPDALPAIGMTCLGFALFSISDALVKLVMEHGYSTYQVMFFSGLTCLLTMFCYGMWRSGASGFRSACYRLHALRGVISVSVFVLVMYALQKIQLDEFYALIFLAPFFVALMGAVLLKDEVGPQRMGAIVVGFGAVLYMLRPETGIDGLGAAAVILASILFAGSMIVVRFMPPGENRALFPIPGALCNLAIGAVLLPGVFIVPSVADALLFLSIGTIGAFGSLCSASGFAMAKSSATVAPFHYTQILWGVALGYVLFGDVPNPTVIGGATVLIATGVYLLRHETRGAALQPKRARVTVLRRSK